MKRQAGVGSGCSQPKSNLQPSSGKQPWNLLTLSWKFMNNRSILPLTGFCFVFNSNSRANINCLWSLIQNQLQKQTRYIYIYIIYFKRKLNQVSVYSLAWLPTVTTGIRKCNSASNYIMIFGKYFHIYKLIHIDQKQRVLIVSLSLALLLNN